MTRIAPRIALRITLLAAGLGLGELGLDSVAHDDGIALTQLGLAVLMLVAGSAGFIAPLLAGNGRQEVSR